MSAPLNTSECFFKEELTIAFLSAPLPVHYTCTVLSETYHFLV